MCNSHLDYKLMLRDTDARVQGVSAPKLGAWRPSFAIFEKISGLLKGFARV